MSSKRKKQIADSMKRAFKTPKEDESDKEEDKPSWLDHMKKRFGEMASRRDAKKAKNKSRLRRAKKPSSD